MGHFKNKWLLLLVYFCLPVKETCAIILIINCCNYVQLCLYKKQITKTRGWAAALQFCDLFFFRIFYNVIVHILFINAQVYVPEKTNFPILLALN